MSKIITTVIFCMFLAGCNFLPTRTVYEEYPVPVYKVPEPPTIIRPHLPIYDLSASDTTDTEKVVRAYIISVRLLLNYSRAQEQILRTYKDLAEATKGNEGIRTLSRTSLYTDRPLSRPEMNVIHSTAIREEERAIRSFETILENYNTNKEQIWRDFNEFRTD